MINGTMKKHSILRATIKNIIVALIFGIIQVPLLIQELPGKARGFCYCLTMCMFTIGYFLWNPFAYGLTTPDLSVLIWNRNWVNQNFIDL